jgi:hypothetical protein
MKNGIKHRLSKFMVSTGEEAQFEEISGGRVGKGGRE